MTSPHNSQHWNERYRSAESVWSLEPNALVVKLCERLPVGSMLDLGGGEGRNALWFAERGWAVENSDFSEVAITKFLARAEKGGVAHQCVGTIASATTHEACATSPVDLVVMCFLHLSSADLQSAIQVAADSLREGGTFFGVWHERGNIGRGLGGPQNPDFTPTVEQLQTMAHTAGLSVTQCEIHERPATRDGVTGTAIDVLLLAAR